MTGRPNYSRMGKEQEQRIVRYVKPNGFPHADRIIRTGAGAAYSVRPDQGDLWLCPGVMVQSKRLSPVSRMERAVPGWMTETEAQRQAAGAAVGLLVVRREGTTDVGEWWAFLPMRQLRAVRNPAEAEPVRMLVRDALVLLRAEGYGDPLVTEAVS